MESSDFLFALTLQKETEDVYDQRLSPTKKIITSSFGNPTVQRPLSVIDESWELLDPNPDVRALFLEFNDHYFWGRLVGVEVKWSPRMTSCAGVCSYEGRGGLCSIRLSVPLLKLRPRKDLVETLLHEMIHAFLFVADNDRDREEHGPSFKNHMHRINKASGANITIYHDFHAEVDSYRQHWWQCNGPCKSRPPYFGFVKRAMNRAPSPKDYWWGDHARSCGGTYTKVKEPEGFDKKNKRKEDKEEIESVKNKKAPQSLPVQHGDIRKIFWQRQKTNTKVMLMPKTSLVSIPFIDSDFQRKFRSCHS
ncbi:sprT-like domain-containing protein Spartan isoform X1 [Pomacea canaliculata]|uniref:sprT-like domain-containing protein Spartan isoform X1 n=1 Tax=Pomacea canaliculata TaxID=400727 RepID=UPI000D731A64|nr:sprT-like domain-containing protein Spartan isoform X1 [Pomacea canaliculata]